MLLTQCAACAKPLALDAPRCVRCWTRYCDASCQLEHWSNGHKKQCKKIARGGGAEQFYADAKVKEAAIAAVAKCRPSVPADACCVICGQDGTEEGLLGPTGEHYEGCHDKCTCYAHVSCLLREKQIAVADTKHTYEREGNTSYVLCSKCGKGFFPEAAIVLGYGCWASNLRLGSKADDGLKLFSLDYVAHSLVCLRRHGEAIPVYEGLLGVIRSISRGLPATSFTSDICKQFGKLITCYDHFERYDDALRLSREAWEKGKVALGPEHEQTLGCSYFVIIYLSRVGRRAEATTVAVEQLPLYRRVFGEDHELTRTLTADLGPWASLADS